MSGKPEPITVADIEALAELFGNAGPYVTARTLSDYWLYARLFSSTCLCIRDEARLVAAIVAFRDQTPGAEEIYIQDVAVHSGHRRKGYGEALLQELLQRAGDWAVSRLWLTSETDNTRAIQLWSKLGFVNSEADYFENGVWLTRNLKGPGRDRAVYEVHLRGNAA